MPALTISTDHPVHSRSSSPVRPPISPITPTLPPARLPGTNGAEAVGNGGRGGVGVAAAATTSTAVAAGGGDPPTGRQPLRQTFTHTQPDQVGIQPPAPEPIDFDSNTDVIALKSAISLLQMQQQRATEHVRALSKAKDDAVEDPEAFIQDLLAGKVNSHRGATGQGIGNSIMTSNDDGDDEDEDDDTREAPRTWTTLPKPQEIVRCPPINWSQYAVVGESLNKLHAEQIQRPTQGTPAAISPDGMYEFKGGDGKQERYLGVAAPYSPIRDKIERKSKGKK